MTNLTPSQYVDKFLKEHEVYQTRTKGTVSWVFPGMGENGGDVILSEDVVETWVMQHAKSVGYKTISPKEREKMNDVIDNQPVVIGDSFYPGNNAKFCTVGAFTYRNTWRPFVRVEPADGVWPDISDTLELYERVTADPVERKFGMQFIAHMIQRPDERPLFGLMINGAQRCGKSLAYHDLPTLLLSQQVYSTTTLSGEPGITGQRSTNNFWNKMLFVADDYNCDRATVADRLKYLVTANNFEVWPLYQSATEIHQAYTRFVLISNHRVPMRFGEDGDNRWFVPAYSHHKLGDTPEGIDETREFCSKLVEKWRDPVYLTAVYDYFNSMDLSDFTPNKPMDTPEHRQLLQQSADQIMDDIRELLDRESTPRGIYGPVVTVWYICDHLYPNGYSDKERKTVAKRLGNLGFTKVDKDLPKRWDLNKRRVAFWCMPGEEGYIIELLDKLEDGLRRVLAGVV
ncbi:TPA: primase-helicase family protein [Escherichia coli]